MADNERRRALADPASNVISDTTTPNASAYRRRRWAHALISRAQSPPPSYGSEEWMALPEGDAAKIAAVVISAEAWVTDHENIAENLQVELEASARAEKTLEDEAFRARRDAHRERYSRLRLVRGAYADTDEFRGGGAA